VALLRHQTTTRAVQNEVFCRYLSLFHGVPLDITVLHLEATTVVQGTL
jgi:hypothetical protein